MKKNNLEKRIAQLKQFLTDKKIIECTGNWNISVIDSINLEKFSNKERYSIIISKEIEEHLFEERFNSHIFKNKEGANYQSPLRYILYQDNFLNCSEEDFEILLNKIFYFYIYPLQSFDKYPLLYFMHNSNIEDNNSSVAIEEFCLKIEELKREIESCQKNIQKLISLPLQNSSPVQKFQEFVDFCEENKYKLTVGNHCVYITLPIVQRAKIKNKIQEFKLGKYTIYFKFNHENFNGVFVKIKEFNKKYERLTKNYIHTQVSRDGILCIGSRRNTKEYNKSLENLSLNFKNKKINKENYEKQLKFLKENPPIESSIEYLRELLEKHLYIDFLEFVIDRLSEYEPADCHITLDNLIKLEEPVCGFCGKGFHSPQECKEAVSCKFCKEFLAKSELDSHMEEYHSNRK